MPESIFSDLVLAEADALQIESDVANLARLGLSAVTSWREAAPGGGILVCWRYAPVQPKAAPDMAPVIDGIPGRVAAAAARVGVPADLLLAFGLVESGLNPKAQNKAPGATAFGLFQIIDRTWAALIAKYGARHGLGSAADERANIDAQCLMAAEGLRETRDLLRGRLGRLPDAAESYAGHFLGGSAAAAVIMAPDAPALATLRSFYAATKFGGGFADKIVASNRAIMGDDGSRTGAEVVANLRGRIAPSLEKARALLGAAPAALPQAAPPQPATVAPGPATAAKQAEEAPWLAVAEVEEAAGVAEIPGSRSNDRIVEYFSWCSIGPQPDEVPWCAAFLAFCLGQAGMVERGHGSALARFWLGWGRALEKPRMGCVVVLKPQAPKSSGHVGFLVGIDATGVTLLGGNQSDRVMRKRFGLDQVQPMGFRWPA